MVKNENKFHLYYHKHNQNFKILNLHLKTYKYMTELLGAKCISWNKLDMKNEKIKTNLNN